MMSDSSQINYYFKHKCIKFSNQKTENGWTYSITVTMISCLEQTCFSFKETRRFRIKEWKKIFQVNGNQTRAEIAIFISNKIEFKVNIVKRNRGWLYNDRGVSAPKWYNSCKIVVWIGPILEHLINKANTNRTKMKNKQQYNNSWGY